MTALPVRAAHYRTEFADAAANVYTAVEMMTPERARMILDTRNTHNRSCGASYKTVLAAIRRGVWMVTGQPIIFDRHGVLLDGQHRLTAIAETGETVPVLVVYGVKPEAFIFLDQNKKRTTADILSVKKKPNVNTLAAAMAWQKSYESGGLGTLDTKYRRLTPDEVESFLAAHPGMEESASVTGGRLRNKRFTAGLQTFLHYQFSALDPAAADLFFERVGLGVGIQPNTHEYLLMRHIDESPVKQVRTIRTQTKLAAVTIKVWSRIRTGAVPGRQLQWRNDEQFPEIV